MISISVPAVSCTRANRLKYKALPSLRLGQVAEGVDL